MRAKCRQLQNELDEVQVHQFWAMNHESLHLRVSSPCTSFQNWNWEGSRDTSAHNRHYRWWASWCPCCKRPLDLTLFDVHTKEKEPPLAEQVPESKRSQRFAYVITLWGADAGFALGALVLGTALRRSGTKYDLVLLYTEDVPTSTLNLLSTLWLIRKVQYLEGHDDMYMCKGFRFDGVFTKLHVLSLVEYDKVLMMDIDLAVIGCPDAVFDLNAPAAMCRGQVAAAWPHGSEIDGRRFFAGEEGEGNL